MVTTASMERTGLAVSARDGIVMVRDRKRGDEGPVLTFTDSEWAAFVQGVRAGEFDLDG